MWSLLHPLRVIPVRLCRQKDPSEASGRVAHLGKIRVADCVIFRNRPALSTGITVEDEATNRAAATAREVL
jgi:hypothetical protein